MNRRFNVLYIAITILAIFLTTACTEETAEEDPGMKEQRFFDIYQESRYPGSEPLASGLFFLENSVGEGVSPDEDDWVLVKHVSSVIPDEVIYESYIENVAEDNNLDPNQVAMYGPFKMLNGSINEGLTEGLTLMREGGEATMFFTSELGFGETGNGKIGGFKSLKYEVELLEVIPDIEAYEQAHIDSYMDTVAVSDTIHDPIEDVVMYYIIDLETEGKAIGLDSVVAVAYKGYLADGRVFDESSVEDSATFTVGPDVITGWELGLQRMKEGEKGRFVIPYQLAYGEEGRKDPNSGLVTMPPYETLFFDIEILSVKGASGDDGSSSEQ